MQIADTFDNELNKAEDIIDQLIYDRWENGGEYTNVIYVSDSHELQSVMMYVCHERGITYARTTKETYAA